MRIQNVFFFHGINYFAPSFVTNEVDTSKNEIEPKV